MTRLATAAVLLLALVAGACRGSNPKASPAAEAQPTRRGAPPGPVTPEFQAMRSVLSKASALATQKDEAELRVMSQEIVETGIGLIRATMPHDLARADVPRFLEGRAAFGDALKDWSAKASAPDATALYASLAHLVDAYWGWVDAYKGLAPEKAV